MNGISPLHPFQAKKAEPAQKAPSAPLRPLHLTLSLAGQDTLSSAGPRPAAKPLDLEARASKYLKWAKYLELSETGKDEAQEMLADLEQLTRPPKDRNLIPAVYWYVARCWNQEQNPAEVLKAADAGIKAGPTDGDILAHLQGCRAEALFTTSPKCLDDAIKALNAGLKAKPNFAIQAILYLKAGQMLKQKKGISAEKRLEILDKGVAAAEKVGKPTRRDILFLLPSLHLARSLVFEEMNDKVQGKEAARIGFNLNPSNKKLKAQLYSQAARCCEEGSRKEHIYTILARTVLESLNLSK